MGLESEASGRNLLRPPSTPILLEWASMGMDDFMGASEIRSLPHLEEVNIGHAIIYSLEYGLEKP